MRRRLLILILLVLVLVGGLWWNSTQLTALNETERKLVGVGEPVNSQVPTATLMLADRREFVVTSVNGKWECQKTPSGRWAAFPGSIRFRLLPPLSSTPSVRAWLGYWVALWHPAYIMKLDLDLLTNDQIEYAYAGKPTAYRRSIDPELLRLFDRLSAEESP